MFPPFNSDRFPLQPGSKEAVTGIPLMDRGNATNGIDATTGAIIHQE
jgi:hypothetical protein